MAEIVIYKAPGVYLDNEEAWENLASQLRSLRHDVRREDAYLKPGQAAAAYAEVIWIYLGLKAIDVIADRALGEVIDRVLDTVKRWGRERLGRRKDIPRQRMLLVIDAVTQWSRKRLGKRKDVPRVRPLRVNIADEDGKILKTWTIGARGEREFIPGGDEALQYGVPIEVREAVSPSWQEIVGDREPQVLFQLWPSRDEAELKVDAYVEGQRRNVAYFTRLPGEIVVTTPPGEVATFHIGKTLDATEFEVFARGYRCEIAGSSEQEFVLVFCYADN